MITAGSIKVYSRFSISSLLDMEMETKEGCHSRLALRGLLSEGKNGTELSQDAVVVKGTDEEGREETLFCGTIQETHIFHENGVGQVILTAASGSVRMDKRKRSRSFQDTSLPCAEVMRGIVSEYGGTLDCEDPTMKIGTPMVQYEETDWEFCRRLAGRMGWGLFSCPEAATPTVSVGLAEGKRAEFPEGGYRCCVDSEYYRHRGKGDTERAEFLYYEVESGRNHEIGDSAWYRRQKRYIFEKRAELEGGVLKFSYKLGGKCRVMRAEQPNRNIAGASLTGEVERDEKEAVYVRLDIDGKGGKAAHPYPWCPATGSMAYCMPQPGTKVSVYFPDCHEGNAIAIHSEHRSGAGFGDVQDRGLATEHGKQMQLHADSLSFQSKSIKGEQVLMLGQDSLRIKAGHTVVTGKEGVAFCAPSIGFVTPREISQYKAEGPALERGRGLRPKGSRNPATGGDACFSVQSEFNGFARQGVMAGTEYERYFAFQDAPAYEKDYATGWKILAGIATAIVVGVAIGALVFATGGIAASILGVTAAQLAVGTGVVTAGAGMLATAGTYINDKRYGTTSSIFDYIGNSYTGSVMVGGSLVGLYLSLTGAEALTYLMTGGSMMVPVFGTVIYTKEIMAATMVTALWTSGANVLFQLEDLRMFLAGEKPLRAPTGNQRYDTAKAWAEMATSFIAFLGLQNPRTYGPTYERLPDPALPGAVDTGTSGSTALATQNTGIANLGGGSGAGGLALLPQNAQTVTYLLTISDVGNSVTHLSGTGGRLIPGTEGVVIGGDSTKLGKNMMESMGLPRGTNWTGHQAQHIIPAEMANHPVLQKIGMNLDDASNGLFLRTPTDDISTMSRHRGYHSTYNEFVKTQLDAMDINQSVEVLQNQVYDLQQSLKYLQQNGLPLYPSQGATVDLWQRSLERINKWMKK